MSRILHDQSTTFAELGVRPPLVRALHERGITTAFPIQAASLPDSLQGRDVLGRGRTGSGKTVAFALPVLERLLSSDERRSPGRPHALILVPTRELAVQVQETVEFLARAVRLKSMTVFGGVRYTGQVRKLERGIDIVVATPGRLEDLIEQGALRLDDVDVVVLDEADLMADMGFLPAVTRILDAVPAGGQRMLFSATLDNDVESLVKKYLNNPLIHSVESAESEPDAVHYLFLVGHDSKAQVVQELLAGGGRSLAFTRTRFAAERLANSLTEAGIPAADLHGNLRQGARQRNLASFADGSVSVLVATDIAARGIHVDDVGLVLHVDPPNDPKAFLHRSGRTARAGASGTVVTLATKNQNKSVRMLMGQAKIKPKQVVVAPGDEIITELRAPRIEPAASGTSIFEPDPEDTIEFEDDVQDQRPGRRQRPERQERRRDTRAEYPRRDHRDRPEREAEAGLSYRPRKEPKQHATGARGPRQDWSDTRPRPHRTAAPERDGRRPAPEGRPAGQRDRWGWGPEPWETDERPGRRPTGKRSEAFSGQGGRQGRPARQDRGFADSRSSRDDGLNRGARPSRDEGHPRAKAAWRETDDRGRISAVSDAGASRPAAGQFRDKPAKARWTAEDRRRAAESEAHGFGFRKGGKVRDAGRVAKPAPGKKGIVRDKDKGKPKRKAR